MRFSDLPRACGLICIVLTGTATAQITPTCQELFAASSRGDPDAAYTLAGDFVKPGGCGYNIRTAYRYLEIGENRKSPVEGLRQQAATPGAVYLLAAWARREHAIPAYSVDPSVVNKMTVTDVARRIEADRQAISRSRPIPKIPVVSIANAYQNLSVLLEQPETSLNEIRGAILGALMALRYEGFSQANYELALYFHKSPSEEDQKVARELLADAAVAGHRSASVILAQAVENGGWGFEQDIPLACAIYKVAKAMGCPTNRSEPPPSNYTGFLSQLIAAASSPGAYKGAPVPYMNTKPEGIWWVLENAFDY